MNYFERNRLYLFIIILLAIFNISALAAIFYHIRLERRQGRPEREENHERGRHLAEKLGFTKEQTIQFDSLRADYGRKTNAITGLLEEKKHEMLSEFVSENPDTSKLFKIADEIGTLHAKFRHLTIEHFLKIKNSCTPEQQKKLNDLFHNMIRVQESSHPFGRQFRHGNPWNKNPYIPEKMPF